ADGSHPPRHGYGGARDRVRGRDRRPHARDRAARVGVLHLRAALTGGAQRPGTFPGVISTVIFDFGGVISSPLFVGIGDFEAAEGYPKGSLLRLMFGETHYIGIEGRAVADALAADPDGAEAAGEIEDEPDWHLLE